MSLVYGVGINDSDNPVDSDGVRCPFYIQWKNVLARCYSESFQRNQPLYKGCTMDDKWLRFSTFKKWMMTQDWKGKQLDKDVIVEGNLHYGPDTCLYVDRTINSFFVKGKRRELPKGVYSNGTGWVAKVRNFKTGGYRRGKTRSSIEEAKSDYHLMQHTSALELAETQTDPRIIQVLKTRFLPPPR